MKTILNGVVFFVLFTLAIGNARSQKMREDINNDGTVSVSDITQLVDVVTGKSLPTPIEYYDKSTEVTVGANGNFTTLNDALTYMSQKYPLYKKGGLDCIIRILSGTTISEQVFVNKQDLQYITIIADDALVPVVSSLFTNTADAHDSRGDYPFLAAENGATLPTIGCVFKLMGDAKIAGCLANRGSKAIFLDGAGFDGFYDGVISNNESSVVIRNGVSRNMKRWGVHARHNGEVSARSCDVSGCGIGVYADRLGHADARDAKLNGCGQALVAYNVSIINANSNAEMKNCGIVGGLPIVDSQNASVINAQGLSFISPLSDVFSVSGGAQIVATGTKVLTDNEGLRILSQTANTWTKDGIIFQ